MKDSRRLINDDVVKLENRVVPLAVKVVALDPGGIWASVTVMPSR